MPRIRLSLSALLALLILALGAGSCQALTQQDAEAVASAHFPAARANCPDLRVEWGETKSEHGAIGLAYIGECRIGLDSSDLVHSSWEIVCLTLTHEFGHISGLTFPENVADEYHSLDPDNVMNASTLPATEVPECAVADERKDAAEAKYEAVVRQIGKSLRRLEARRDSARNMIGSGNWLIKEAGWVTGPSSVRLRHKGLALRERGDSLLRAAHVPTDLLHRKRTARQQLTCAEQQIWLTTSDECPGVLFVPPPE